MNSVDSAVGMKEYSYFHPQPPDTSHLYSYVIIHLT